MAITAITQANSRMRRLLNSLAILSLGLFAGSCRDLNVVSFNMFFEYGWTAQAHLAAHDSSRLWVNRCPVARETFEKYRFDIVGTQELLTFQLEDLCRDGVYSWIGKDLWERNDGMAEHEAIIYRNGRIELLEWDQFWYSDTPEVSSTWGIHVKACTCGYFIDRASGHDFYLFNSHFHVTPKDWQKGADGHVLTAEEAVEIRVKSARLLVDRINAIVPEGKPVFVTGDLNSVPESAPVAAILAGGFADARFCVSPKGPYGTLHAFKREASDERIDYVFVRGKAKVKSYEVLSDQLETGRWSSDHLPVLVKVKI